MIKPADIWKAMLTRIGRNREVAFLILAGILTIACIDTLAVQKLQHEQQYRQTLMAQRLQAQLQSLMEEHVTALIALNVVYQNFVDINHYDFQQYGASITNNLKGFRRLMYLSPNMTIERIYPLTPENTRLVTASVAGQPDVSKLLKRAKTTHQPTSSSLITFMEHPRSVIAAIPIYRNNTEFLGYAAGEISLEEIWGLTSHKELLEKYEIQVLDPQGNPFFSGVNFSKHDRIVTKIPFLVGDQQWKLQLQPVQPIFEAIIMQRFGLWAAGLLILYLIVMLMIASKRHKITLEEAQRQFETIFHASPDGILLLNENLELQLANKPVQDWSGKEQPELARKNFFDVFTCQCPNLNKCRELSYLLCTSDQFDDRLPETLETLVTHPGDGITRTLRLNASRFEQQGLQKQRSGFICVLGDISTSKELERVKETYIATLTHDLKTPLLAQEMVLDSILSGRAGEVNAEQKKLLRGASQSVQDLVEMVNATLLYYKIESAHLALHKQPIPLVPMVKELSENLVPLLNNRKLSIEIDAGLELPDPLIDPIQMKRVLHNLLSNAISYARRGTAILVKITPEAADRVLIQITNHGKGIPPEDLPKIFDKYYSLSRKFKQIGTGLGLYISRQIVQLHGGKIWATSEPDKETSFYISLPCPQKVQSSN